MNADLNLSPLAQRLGVWIAERSEDGLSPLVPEEKFLESFRDVPLEQLKEAIAELEMDGYVTAARRIGITLPRIRPRNQLYEVFDPVAIGSDPVADAGILIATVLEDGNNSVSVPALHKRTDWPLRRFNPAIAVLLGEVDERRVSREIDPQYPARHFHLLAEDRVSLRRLATQLQE